MKQTAIVQASNQGISAEVLQSTTPVVIKGGVKHWPLICAEQEDFPQLSEQLLSHYNQKSVLSYQASPECDGRYFYNEDCSTFDFEKKSTTLDDFFVALDAANSQTDAPSIFIPSMHLDSYFPALRENLPLDIEGVNDAIMQAWIGSPSVIACHFDAMKNLACCVAGKRRFTLFPPEQIENLYVGPVDLTPAGQAISLVDMRNPDLQKFPLFEKALLAGEQAILEPGDVLYLPSMWWHQVEGLAPRNLMINYWWRTTPRILGEPLHALDHAMMTLRALPLEERKAWQAVFEHYIFNDNADKYEHIPEQARGRLAPLDEMGARRLRAMLLSHLNR